MKQVTLLILIVVSLAACSIPPAATLPAPMPTAPEIAPVTAETAAEAAGVRALVENFGQKLKLVSLLAPDATQEIRDQYAAFVSPALLDRWMNDVSQAPGRLTSSPWPDRIEITSLARDESGGYVITGTLVEITSMEVSSGGAAVETPVRILVQKLQGRWLITEYTADR